MSKVVLVNQTSGYLMIDIVNAYLDSYDEVVLIAGHIDEFSRKLRKEVIVKRICEYNRSTLITRGWTWVLATLQIFFILLLRYRKSHIVYVTNPPMSYFPSTLLRNKFSIIVYDIYPDALLNIGIKASNPLFGVWSKINKRIFDKAVNVYTLSMGMAKLLSNYCCNDKIKVIPNWGASDDFSPISKNKNIFIKEHNLEDKFVVMYSGNMGVTHNVEVILELAKKMRNDKKIIFCFIGDGAKKKELIEVVEKDSLNNCFFLPWQPPEQVKFSLSAADLSIITLTEDTAQVSVPSKTYNLLAVGAPLLCIVPQNSEISLLVEKYNCGKCFRVEQISEMVDFIKELYLDSDYKEKLSLCSLKASKEFTYFNAGKYVF